MIFLYLYLLIGFLISVLNSYLARGKKIKPSIKDTVFIVFLWFPFLIEAAFWHASLTDQDKKEIYKLIDEDE